MLPHPLQGAPFGDMLDLCILLTVLALVLSVLTREYSWVDRLWSTAPMVYATYVAYCAGFADLRLNGMALLVIAWGSRLTFNFARKGGFWKGGEDYRWRILRQRLGPVGFQLLNIGFIGPVQMGLIWLFTAPVHTAWVHRGTPLGWLDGLCAALFVALLVGETWADEQMWAFQQDKKARVQRGEPVDQPFYRGGLYRISRHPYYFCEIGQWWVFYGFAVAASGAWLQWTGVGFVLLTLLFDRSVAFGESISVSRYPTYRDYQKDVSRIVPFLKGVSRG